MNNGEKKIHREQITIKILHQFSRPGRLLSVKSPLTLWIYHTIADYISLAPDICFLELQCSCFNKVIGKK